MRAGSVAGKSQIGLAHATLKRKPLPLEPIGTALGGTGKRIAGVKVEHDGEIGDKATAAKRVRTSDKVGRETTASGLVGVGRVVEAIAHHEHVGRKRGLDDLTHELGTGGLVEEKLALVAHLGIGRVEKHRADALGDGRATRLSQANEGDARILEHASHELRLRGLPTAVDALEGDEGAATRRGGCRLDWHADPSPIWCGASARQAEP